MSDRTPATISPYLPADMPEAVAPARHARARAAWDRRLRKPLELEGAAQGLPEAWFLGPKAENLDLLKSLVDQALDSHAAFRRSFHPEDPSHITPALQQSARVPGGGGAAALGGDGPARQAAPVGPLRLHALPGAHAVGPGDPRHGRPVRRHALQPEQRGGRGVPRHHAAGDRGRQRPVPHAGLPRAAGGPAGAELGPSCPGATSPAAAPSPTSRRCGRRGTSNSPPWRCARRSRRFRRWPPPARWR